jgi:hypothetical protein
MQLLFNSTRKRAWPVDVTKAKTVAAMRIPGSAMQATSMLMSSEVGLLPWNRMLRAIVSEQLGRWAAARENEDTQLKLENAARFRAKHAALPIAARTTHAAAALHAESWAAEAALPTAVSLVARLCFPPAVANLRKTHILVRKRLRHGRRLAALLNRFGIGIVCLPTMWHGVK